MLQVGSGSPSDLALSNLAEYQRQVDEADNYPEQVAAAKAKWGSVSKANATFTAVKEKLEELCPGLRRCVYCEDSYADEIEHIHPKDWTPELCFSWGNYIYACGPCNGPKSNRYGVVPPGGNEVEELPKRKSNDPVVPPPLGDAALIHPREEDPLDSLELDLGGTFRFLPTEGAGDLARSRTEFTVDVLHLNDRESLVEGRRGAMANFMNGLLAYRDARDGGATEEELAERRNLLLKNAHLTVWHEMKRQRQWYAQLTELFEAVPEALQW